MPRVQNQNDVNFCSCLPDTAGKTAAAAFCTMLVAATVIAILILIQHNPSLNTIFYPVFGVIGGIGLAIFAVALINMCKPKLPPQEASKKSRDKEKDHQPPASPPIYPLPMMNPMMMSPYHHSPMMYSSPGHSKPGITQVP